MARRLAVTPREHERLFNLDELFFSTTDLKGIIQSGNEVFKRVSGYEYEELIGQPHNIIRHPSMPRAVFKLLWDYLNNGRVFAGYVKNMAADGSFYWVTALVVPIKNGYLSIRFKPSSPYWSAAKDVYAELLTIEQAAGEETGAWRDGMNRAVNHLPIALKKRGFPNYDSFMHTILSTEMASRRSKLLDNSVKKIAGYPSTFSFNQSSITNNVLESTLHICEIIEKQLEDLFTRVDSFLNLIQKLDSKSSFLLDLSDNIHLVSLNTLIASHRLDQTGYGGGLAVVTQNLASISEESTTVITEMTKHLSLSSPLRETAFAITAAKLQVEMTIFFIRELLRADGKETVISGLGSRMHMDIDILIDSFSNSTERMLKTLVGAQNSVSELIQLHEQLTRSMRKLSNVHVTGKVQASYVSDSIHLQELFDMIYDQLQLARNELKELSDGIPFLEEHLPKFEVAGQSVQKTLKGFREASASANSSVAR
jgi:PAS domain S-box-containing protein